MNLKERRREFLNYDKKRYLQLLKNKSPENYMELLAFFKFNLLKKKMEFSKRGNIYVVTRVTGRQNNILGICFADEDYNSTGNNNNIEVIDWKFPKVTSTKIRTSKTELLDQVLSGLNFKNQETFLFYENRNEYSELLSYQIILEDQIYYNGKNDYISLVQEYLDYLKENENAREDKDVAGLFVKEFWSLYRADTRALKILKKEVLEQGISRLSNFYIDPKSKKFSELIAEIVSDCESLTFNPENIYGLALDQFPNSIEKTFLEIKNYLNE